MTPMEISDPSWTVLCHGFECRVHIHRNLCKTTLLRKLLVYSFKFIMRRCTTQYMFQRVWQGSHRTKSRSLINFSVLTDTLLDEEQKWSNVQSGKSSHVCAKWWLPVLPRFVSFCSVSSQLRWWAKAWLLPSEKMLNLSVCPKSLLKAQKISNCLCIFFL